MKFLMQFCCINLIAATRAQRSSDTVRVVPEAYALKLSIFVAQRLALHQNGVEFCQLSIGDTRISLATSYDVVRRRFVYSMGYEDEEA